MALLSRPARRVREHAAPFDPYEDAAGQKMGLEVLLAIREMEDYWIALGHMSEHDRIPVPDHLRPEWERVINDREGRRTRRAR